MALIALQGHLPPYNPDVGIIVFIFLGKETGAHGVKLLAQVTELMSDRAGLEPGEFSEACGLLTTIPQSSRSTQTFKFRRIPALAKFPHMEQYLRRTSNAQ